MIEAAAPGSRAPSVAGRHGWFALALTPACALLAWQSPSAFGGHLLVAAVAAILVSAGVLALLGQPMHHLRRDPGALALALLCLLWLPASIGAAGIALAVALAVAIHTAFGGTGQSPFHPAAAGVAVVSFALAPAESAPDTGLALALGAGVLLMLGRRLLHWPSLLGLAAGAALGALVGFASGQDEGAPPSSAWLLVGGFVLADGGSTGLRTASRLGASFAVGLLAMILPGPAALPCAVLLANVLLPWLEAVLPGRTRR